MPFDITHFLDFHNVEVKAKELINHTPQPYFVIVKGSQNTIFLEEVVKSLLAHPEDENKLTRQGARRDHKKQEFLSSQS